MPRYTSETTHGEKIIRLFTKLLFSKRKWGLVELANDLNCSKQTVMRMVDEIENGYSARIVSEKDERGRRYYQLERMEKYDPVLNLSRSEVDVLMMCRSFTKHILGNQLFDEATCAIEKSEAQIPAEERAERPHFDAIMVGTIDYTGKSEQIHNLIRAMDALKVCKISYTAIKSSRLNTFYIKPIKLFSHKNALYLHAKLAKYPGRKYRDPDFDPLLAVHRITNVEVTDRNYEYPENFNFEKSFNQTFGLMKDHAFEVEVEFRGWAATYAAERIWSRDQKISKQKNGSIRLTFSASSELELISWVLSFGEAAVLLKPKSAVAKLKSRLTEMNKIYASK